MTWEPRDMRRISLTAASVGNLPEWHPGETSGPGTANSCPSFPMRVAAAGTVTFSRPDAQPPGAVHHLRMSNSW